MDRHKAIKLYMQAWTQRTAADIRVVLDGCWAETGTYTDPITDPVSGVDEMVELILSFGKRFPGATLQDTSELDLHHHVGRFNWVMTSPTPILAGETNYGTTLTGVDFVEFATDGSITRITGFFD